MRSSQTSSITLLCIHCPVLTRFSNVFALIVGINKYLNKRYHTLKGAVQDANSISEFILHYLKADPDHIINLQDKQATHDAIVRAIEGLAADPRIRKDNPIIIYFAGHGNLNASFSNNLLDEPRSWNGTAAFNEGAVAELCSVDAGTQDPRDSGIAVVPRISKFVLSALMRDLSIAKGNNIVSLIAFIPFVLLAVLLNTMTLTQTMILDCCYSAGIHCDDYPKLVMGRAFGPPAALNSSPDGKRGGYASFLSTTFGRFGRDRKSHVLLAACGPNELAHEVSQRGLFTTKLLEVLKESVLDL